MSDWYCVDGEGIGKKTYALMRDNAGRKIVNRTGLSTEECFEFLLEPCKGHMTGAVYGLNYDANNWLKDLSKPKLEKLWDKNKVRFGKYRIFWVPSKWFVLEDRKTGRSLILFEVFGFFQMSFVKACEDWEIHLDEKIEEMKDARGSHTADDLDELGEYCHAECIALSELMDKLQATIRAVGLDLKSWHGAGAVASALMMREGSKEHHRYDVELSEDGEYEDEIMRAYFGGRVEPLAQGFVGECTYYDVVSAYPTATEALPGLVDTQLEHVKAYFPKARHAIWRVQWSNLEGLVMPFPVRHKKGDIYYPSSGEGTYHAIEVKAALDAGFPIVIDEGWILRGVTEYPFSWVKTVFQVRKEMKAKGDLGAKILKLALNSIYGKTAQGIGEAPPFKSYWWAGEITAYCRARMLGLALQCKPAPYLIATDGIFCPHPLDVELGKQLGGLELEEIHDLWIGRAGVYRGKTDNGFITKTRGFFPNDINYDTMEWGFEKFGDDWEYDYSSKRFIGLGVALHRKDFGMWREWKLEDRSISFFIQRKHKPMGVDTSGRQWTPLIPWSGVLDLSMPYHSIDQIDPEIILQMREIPMDQPLSTPDECSEGLDIYASITGGRF